MNDNKQSPSSSYKEGAKTDNELIAEFMGVKEQQSSYDSYGRNVPHWFVETELFRSRSYNVPNRSLCEFLEQCKYQTSWDWLMPVVEKIASMKNPVFIYASHIQNSVEIFQLYPEEPISRVSGTRLTLLEATYKAVVEYIKWYNRPEK